MASNLLGRVQMRRVLARLWKEESGQDLTEYALLLVLLILVVVSTFPSLANSIGNAFFAAASNLSTAN
jgi:Flp pilus assembly pilin Flp